ncbi:hypothetical protein ACFYRY_36430 [Streptomyces sp. NPDC005263]|uniref:hypothetical protein n=1 Tax=Streptomyces sp. NPDC005263 TaxID=3364711 RepID=UPI0036929914
MRPVRSLFRTRKAASVAVVAAVVASATAVTGASAAGKSPERPVHASVTGSADFRLPYVNDADIRSFTFDAHAAPHSRPVPGVPTGLPTDAYGTVAISHYDADRDTTYTAEGTVDCLVTGPGSATLTAIITKVSANGPHWLGLRLGFSVHDGGGEKPGKPSRDRVGLSWADGVNKKYTEEGDVDFPVGPCMAPAPFAPVTSGGYRVRHADLPLYPKG